MMKKCRKCNLLLPEAFFSKHKGSRDGLQAWCRDCMSDYRKQPQQIQNEKARSQTDHRKSWKKNYRARPDIKAKRQSLEELPIGRMKQRESSARMRLKPERKEWQRNYERTTKRLEYKRQYDQKRWPQRRESVNASKRSPEGRQDARGRDNRRYSKDTKYRFTKQIRNLTKRAIFFLECNDSTEQLLGCSIEHARDMIEQEFESWMTWENHGNLWDIDHVRPLSNIGNVEDLEQVKVFTNITNLRPLDKLTNQQIKRDRFTSKDAAEWEKRMRERGFEGPLYLGKENY